MDGDSEGPQMELAGKTQDIDLPGCSKDLLVGKGGKELLLVGEEMAHLVKHLLPSQSPGPPW